MSPRGVVADSECTNPKRPEATMTTDCTHSQFQLRYRSLFNSGRGFAFPCDARGLVDMETLSDRARNNYLYARAMVGRELSVPAVEFAG
jgi:hypothetical protein